MKNTIKVAGISVEIHWSKNRNLAIVKSHIDIFAETLIEYLYLFFTERGFRIDSISPTVFSKTSPNAKLTIATEFVLTISNLRALNQ